MQLPYDKSLQRIRHRIEYTCPRLKDWRLAQRHDRNPSMFLALRELSAIVLFWQ